MVMPKVGDQSDPYSIEVHPNAIQLRDHYATFHMYWGFDGRLMERVLKLNTKNVNLFMTSFDPTETTRWPVPGANTAKAMKYINVHLRGRHHEGEDVVNAGLKWWQDPEAKVDEKLVLVRRKHARGREEEAS